MDRTRAATLAGGNQGSRLSPRTFAPGLQRLERQEQPLGTPEGLLQPAPRLPHLADEALEFLVLP